MNKEKNVIVCIGLTEQKLLISFFSSIINWFLEVQSEFQVSGVLL